jgi:DNA-binding beta-propeller fold protein YncE
MLKRVDIFMIMTATGIFLFLALYNYAYSDSGKHLFLNPDSETVYAQFGDIILAVNGTTGDIIKNITIESHAWIVINPFAQILYISDLDNIVETDLTNLRVIKNVSIPNYGSVMAFDEKNNLLYMIDDEHETNLAILNESDEFTRGYKIKGITTNLVINPETNRVYVLDDEYDKIYVFDSEQKRVISNVSIIPNMFAMAVNPIRNHVYVATGDASKIGIIDGNTNQVLKYLDSGTPKDPYEWSESSLDIDPATNRLFLSSHDKKLISIFDISNNTLIDKIYSEVAPSRIAFNTHHKVLYVLDTESESLARVSNNNQQTILVGQKNLP